MANISTAYGSMILEGNWSREDIDCLETISKEHWSKWYYNIELEDFDEICGEISANFYGTGRWTFQSNLEALDRWTKDTDDEKILSALKSLLENMQKKSLEIKIMYTDEEGGCLVLYESEATITSNGSDFIYEEGNSTHYEYNLKNYCEVTNDNEMANALAADLCDKVGISHNNGTFTDDNYHIIVEWLFANKEIMPHYWSFDELDEDLQNSFLEFAGVDGAKITQRAQCYA